MYTHTLYTLILLHIILYTIYIFAAYSLAMLPIAVSSRSHDYIMLLYSFTVCHTISDLSPTSNARTAITTFNRSFFGRFDTSSPERRYDIALFIHGLVGDANAWNAANVAITRKSTIGAHILFVIAVIIDMVCIKF